MAAQANDEKREDTAAKKRHVEENAAESRRKQITPETAANIRDEVPQRRGGSPRRR